MEDSSEKTSMLHGQINSFSFCSFGLLIYDKLRKVIVKLVKFFRSKFGIQKQDDMRSSDDDDGKRRDSLPDPSSTAADPVDPLISRGGGSGLVSTLGRRTVPRPPRGRGRGGQTN